MATWQEFIETPGLWFNQDKTTTPGGSKNLSSCLNKIHSREWPVYFSRIATGTKLVTDCGLNLLNLAVDQGKCKSTHKGDARQRQARFQSTFHHGMRVLANISPPGSLRLPIRPRPHPSLHRPLPMSQSYGIGHIVLEFLPDNILVGPYNCT